MLATPDSVLNIIYSEAGNYDRVVIQELLKEIAQTQQVDLSAKQRFKGASFPLIHSYSCWA